MPMHATTTMTTTATMPTPRLARPTANALMPSHKANAPKPATRSLVKDPVRYKTVMCDNWVRDGCCPYDFKCQFAHGKHELRERKAKDPKPSSKASDQDATTEPMLRCSPCSSRSETPPPMKPTTTTETNVPPPIVLTAPPTQAAPLKLSTPPGLGFTYGTGAVVEPKVKKPAAAFGPIDFGASTGAAARFAAPAAAHVPDGVRALWPEAESSSPLRCNRHTGKVESMDSLPRPDVPWVAKRNSSGITNNMVRRAISFVLEEDELYPTRQKSRRNSGRFSASERMSDFDETSERMETQTPERYPEWA